MLEEAYSNNFLLVLLPSGNSYKVIVVRIRVEDLITAWAIGIVVRIHQLHRRQSFYPKLNIKRIAMRIAKDNADSTQC